MSKISEMIATADLPASAYIPIVDPTEPLPENRNKRWTGLQAAFAGKADAAHTHAIDDVANLQATLDGKANANHGHAIAEVTGLQTALNAKAASDHTHAIADVAGLQTALDAKLEWVSPPATATSPGTSGQLAQDASYLYLCTATDSWKRVALTTW